MFGLRGALRSLQLLTVDLLNQAETQPGFINALLDILQGEQVNTVQLSGMLGRRCFFLCGTISSATTNTWSYFFF